MDENRILFEVLKWTALAFAAGLVGYFGKYLGIQIISLFKKERGHQSAEPELQAGRGGIEEAKPSAGQDKERLKQEKKLLKAKIKGQKKQTGEK